MDEYLFVYGTLRMGIYSPMDKLMSLHCQHMSEARFQGNLYDIAGYPGVTDSNTTENYVYGEVFRVQRAKQLWPKLDHYEHCSNAFPRPYEYVRKKRPVLLTNGENLQAWIYLFNWKTGGLLKIPSGDYLEYLLNQR